MDVRPPIVVSDSSVGQRPMLAGTRLDVAQVIATVRAEEGSVERAADYLGLSVPQVRACTQYYVDHEVDVDAYAARVEEENERLRVAWQQDQGPLTC